MKKALLLFCAAVLFSACASEEKKPSSDVLLAQEAFALAEGMRKAYVAKDFSLIKKYSTEEAYEIIVRDIKKFRSVELEFKPRWVEIKGDGTVHLYVSWDGIWSMKDGKEERRGMALFELQGRPLEVSGIITGTPFNQPQGM